MVLACERDDICIEEITPYFIIRFYDDDDPVFRKKVVDIKVDTRTATYSERVN